MNDAFFIAEKKLSAPGCQIKIELDLPVEIINYLKSLEEKDKGGEKTLLADEIIRKLDLPVRPGEQFEVTGGRLFMKNNSCYLLADIQKK
ncbi:MAG: hypothetical protein WEA56_13300 [Balneolaceae bacterium]